MSVLGTGIYNTCTYIGEATHTQTRFIQEATLMDAGADKWDTADRIYIILTKDARKLNWDKNLTERAKQNRTVSYSGLELSLERLGLACPVETVDIPDGKDEGEMWEIFNRIFERLEPGDELYFDLTHAFRYLPMLLMVLGNYAHFLKETNVVYMSYGNYEARKENKEDHATDEAPIINLFPLAVLQDWTSSAFAFKTMGHVKTLADAMKVYSLYADRELSKRIISLSNNLVKFESLIETCRGTEIVTGQVAEEVKESIKSIEKQSLPKPIIEILKGIRLEIQPFEKGSLCNIKAALLWCLKFGLVQQGYTLCQEGIVTVICERLSSLNPYSTGDKKKDNSSYRIFWSSILGVDMKTANDESLWKRELSAQRELARAVFPLEWVQQIRKKYNELTRRRNQLNHAGFVGAMTSAEIIDKFKEIVEDCMVIFDMELTLPEAHSVVDNPKLFINLSNHPSSQWTAEQLAAAEQYGTVTDMPFPVIDSGADSEEIAKLVEETFDRLRSLAAGKTATVHLMGEMTFTYALVRRLKDTGVRCVASTTDREVVDNGDGTRTTRFHFVRFREYER